MKKEIKLPLTRRLDAAVVIVTLSLDGDNGDGSSRILRIPTSNFSDTDVCLYDTSST